MKKDFFWNLIGSLLFAAIYPILTIVISRIVGTDESGIFSVGYVTAQMFMILGNYAVRVYQVSDIEECYSFSDYVLNRKITCGLMIIADIIFCIARGYKLDLFLLYIVICVYKMIDAYADVYEARLQQKKYLYKGGQSLFFRTLIGMISFSVGLWLFKNLMVAIVVLLFSAVVLLYVLAIRSVKKYAPEVKKAKWKNVKELLIQCFPLFLSLFLFTYIINSPKYAIENYLNYSFQTVFNAIYFPAQMIYLVTGFLFKPLIVTMADLKERRDNKLIAMTNKILLIIIIFVIISFGAMYYIGIPIMEWLYGISLQDFKVLAIIMMINGGVIAMINYFYHVLTILRCQKKSMLMYIIAFGISCILPNWMVFKFQMSGAVISYFIVLGVLVLMLGVYSYWKLYEIIYKDKDIVN